MREIKFRIWDDFSHKMYFYPELKKNKEHGDLWWYWDNGGCRANGKAKNSHIMQYTGLKDRTGREIFEGDILDSTRKNGRLRVVEFGDIGWNPFVDDMLDGSDSCYFEIIGNIYENPELC